MNDEAQFYQFLRPLFPGHLQRIENQVVVGMPDLVWCHRGITTWIELKVCIDSTAVLRKEQFAWGMRHWNNGGRVEVLALNQDLLTVNLWHFPKIEVAPWRSGCRYVEITNSPDYYCDKSECSNVMIPLMLK